MSATLTLKKSGKEWTQTLSILPRQKKGYFLIRLLTCKNLNKSDDPNKVQNINLFKFNCVINETTLKPKMPQMFETFVHFPSKK